MSFIASGWNFHEKYWTITSLMRIVTLIYVKLISQNMQTKLTFLLEDSPANHSHLPEKEKGKMMNATCGARCLEQYKRLNRDSSSLKMSLVSRILMADWYSSRCALTWKMKGTKYSRLLFQLQPKTHRIEETDAGLLLKTPCSADAYTENLTKKEQRFGNSGTLAQEVQTGFIYQRGMLPTPTASDVEGGVSNPNQITQKNGRFVRTSNNTGTEFGAKLRDVVGMLPTPQATDWNTATKPETYEARRQRHAAKGVNLQMSLRQMAVMLPTPTVMDSANNGDMTAAAKLMQGATHRSSGQPIQKTLTMEIHQQILADNQPLMEELANKPMLKRTNLPPQKEFVEWIRSVTNAKELSQMIDVKLSTAEHWFRTDAKGFSHPSIEEWTKIAEIFQVTEQMNARMMEQSSIEWTGMLPTPNAAEGYKGAKTYNPKSQMGSSLSAMAGSGMLPTPTAMDSTSATASMKSTQVKEGSMHSMTLSRFLLTPSASDGLRSGMTMDSLKRHNKVNAENSNLAEQIAHKVGGGTSHLNPRFVAEMMGFPVNWTELPFQSGEQNPSKDTETP
jgi:hypothetical protein